MVYWDIFEDMRRLEKRLNRLFEEAWGERMALPGSALERGMLARPELPELLEYREPFVDIAENEKEIKITAELPGIDKKDIKINATENSIEISAEVKKEEKEEKKGYIRRERSYSKFYRSMSLPTTVDPSKATSKYDKGILEITLPKTKVEKKTSIKVE